MDLTTVTLLAFAALALIIVGMFLVIRDLAVGRRRLAPAPKAELLPQVALERELAGSSGTNSRLDRAFGQLIIDSGLPLTTASAFLLMLLVGVTVGAAVFLALDNELLALAVVPLGMALPLIYFMVARANRLARLHEQLPGAITTICRAIRAGESVEDALRLSAQTNEEPIATELGRCAGHLAMGLSMASTMRSLTARVPIQELKILSSAVVVQRSSGGNLAATLDRVIAIIRDRENFRRQFLAGTAGARMAAMLAVVVVPAYLLFMAFSGTDYVNSFFSQPMGMGLLAAGIALFLVGIIWILTLLKVEY